MIDQSVDQVFDLMSGVSFVGGEVNFILTYHDGDGFRATWLRADITDTAVLEDEQRVVLNLENSRALLRTGGWRLVTTWRELTISPHDEDCKVLMLGNGMLAVSLKPHVNVVLTAPGAPSLPEFTDEYDVDRGNGYKRFRIRVSTSPLENGETTEYYPVDTPN